MNYFIKFLLILCLPQQIVAQTLPVTKYSNWSDHHAYSFGNSSDSIWEVTGDFRENDLSGTIQLAWDDEGLLLRIVIMDDIRDTKIITKDSAVFKLPSGRRMDKMYLYDNIKIQLRTSTINYSTWLAPTASTLQWHNLRKQTGTSNTSISSAPPKVHGSTENRMWTLEVKILWTDLYLVFDDSLKLNLLVIINDTDAIGKTVSQRISIPRKFVALSKEIEFIR